MGGVGGVWGVVGRLGAWCAGYLGGWAPGVVAVFVGWAGLVVSVGVTYLVRPRMGRGELIGCHHPRRILLTQDPMSFFSPVRGDCYLYISL